MTVCEVMKLKEMSKSYDRYNIYKYIIILIIMVNFLKKI